jgi:cell fate (sporulation/competence/biofilm development) regulator YlbF (YheA/YmcA/DUF963 family)
VDAANLEKAARFFAEQIYLSELCKTYRAAKKKIDDSDELSGLVKEFKAHRLEYELKKMSDAPAPFDEERRVAVLYSKLIMNDDVKDFFHAERQLFNCASNIQDIIAQAFGADINV